MWGRVEVDWRYFQLVLRFLVCIFLRRPFCPNWRASGRLSAGQMEFPFALGNPRSASLFWIPKAQVWLRGEIYGFRERPQEAALVQHALSIRAPGTGFRAEPRLP